MNPLKHFIKCDTKSKNRWKQCPTCHGYNHPELPCQTCKGTGIIKIDKYGKNANNPSILNPSPPLIPPSIPRYNG